MPAANIDQLLEQFARIRVLAAPERADALAVLAARDASLADSIESLLRFHDAPVDAPSSSSAASWSENEDPSGAGRADFSDAHSASDGDGAGAGGVDIPGIRIVRRIGGGGMGVVFEGEQDRPRRRVAVKLLRIAFPDERMLRRFDFEMDILARMEHPGIAQIYLSGTTRASAAGEQPYFVMEYIDGVPIDQYVRLKALPRPRIVDLLASVADAIHHAHQRGVIHRDIKPGNVLVTSDGRVKVVDFGVARAVGTDRERANGISPDDGDGSIGADRNAGALTLDGALIGTLGYMAPEQAAGRPRDVDASTDVYALGVVGYELLCERMPIDLRGMNFEQAVHAIRERASAAPSSSLPPGCPGLPRDIAAILHRAMAPHRKDRYPDAGELANDLRHYQSHRPVRARRGGPLYRTSRFIRRHRLALAVITPPALFIAMVLLPYVTTANLNLRTTAITDTQAVLTWRDPYSTETGYIVSYLNDTTWVDLLDLPRDTTSTTVGGLSPGNAYNFRVRAQGRLGTMGQSNVVSVLTPSSSLRPPSDFRVLAAHPTQVKLGWGIEPGGAPIASYRLQWSNNPSRVWVALVDLTAGTTEFDVGSLQPGETYFYRLATVADSGTMVFSRPISVTTPRQDAAPATTHPAAPPPG